MAKDDQLAPDQTLPIPVAKMIPAAPLVIHKVLPTEILGIIFEEHAKLQWNAPAIDGRVCGVWKKTVLNTPRAWAYLVITGEPRLPRKEELRSWLLRSCTAPLHIRICIDISPVRAGVCKGWGGGEIPDSKKLYGWPYYDLLSEHHARIVSMQVLEQESEFFEGRGFPCLRFLDAGPKNAMRFTSLTLPWDSMPKLQSLRLRGSSLTWSSLAQPKVLAIYYSRISSIPNHSQSLTTLMLDEIDFKDTIRGPVTLPSLTYLSLNTAFGLKPHLNVPSLVTYHEGVDVAPESFSAPLTSLVEYGVLDLNRRTLDDREWRGSFPNVSRLAVRGRPHVLTSLLETLSRRPRWLPMLQTISVRVEIGAYTGTTPLTEEDRKSMERLIRRRSKACNMEVALIFETKTPPYQIPVFLGRVRYYISNFLYVFDVHSSSQIILTDGRRNLELVSSSMPVYSSVFPVPVLELGTIVVGGEVTQPPGAC